MASTAAPCCVLHVWQGAAAAAAVWESRLQLHQPGTCSWSVAAWCDQLCACSHTAGSTAGENALLKDRACSSSTTSSSRCCCLVVSQMPPPGIIGTSPSLAAQQCFSGSIVLCGAAAAGLQAVIWHYTAYCLAHCSMSHPCHQPGTVCRGLMLLCCALPAAWSCRQHCYNIRAGLISLLPAARPPVLNRSKTFT